MKPMSLALALLALLLLLAVGIGAGCVSPSKASIERRLLALPGNAPLQGRLESLERAVRLDGREHTAQFRFFRAGAAGPGRPVVVLVHGTPSSLVTWTDVVYGPGGLAESCEVYALDVVGHGLTSTRLPGYGFQSCADWVGAFLAALDLRGVTLVGNSYGGEFVWRAALDGPDRVSRVVLISSSGFARRDDEWFPEEVAMRELGLAKLGWLLNSRSRVQGALAPHFQTSVSAEHVEEVYTVCANRQNWHAMVDLARDENGERSAELARLTQPTLLLWGAQDVAYRPETFGQRFADVLPDARLALLPGAGHYPQEEQPARVAEEIAAFARGS
jgi:pimeloyl-ACP methyl ester carboxylesterase